MVKKMSDEDFVSLDTIHKYFVKSVTGISKMQWLQFRKDHPWILFYKTTFNKDMPFSEYSMLAKNPGWIPLQMPPLSQKTNKKKIKGSKYKDLINLLQFVPPIHHRFYRSLDYQGNPLTRQGQSRDQNCDEQSHNENVELENVYDSDSD
uniref:Uncharacterized protein n=2 Tax=Clastoptera arizonana TaxID=38151 RepID=A0A1B6DQY6_9HEMI